MRALVIPDQRIARGAASATLSYQFTDQYGEPSAASGTVTVSVTDSAGSAVVTGQATTQTGTGPYEYTLSSNLDTIDRLTATWLVDGSAAASTVIEVVGGVYCSNSELKALEPTLATRSDAVLRAARTEAENMIEEWCNRAFVHRIEIERRNGTGASALPVSWPNIVDVKWGKVWYSGNSSTSLTASELADIAATRGPLLNRQDGWLWERGVDNIEVAYIHGLANPPEDIKRVCAALVHRQLTVANRALADNATQYFPAEGGSVMMAQPGMRGSFTGIPWMDEILKRWQWRNVGVH